jgi:hypothetical protein
MHFIIFANGSRHASDASSFEASQRSRHASKGKKESRHGPAFTIAQSGHSAGFSLGVFEAGWEEASAAACTLDCCGGAGFGSIQALRPLALDNLIPEISTTTRPTVHWNIVC